MTLRYEHSTCRLCLQTSAMILVGTPDPATDHDGYEYECQFCGESRHYTVDEINAIREEWENEQAGDN